MSRAPTDRDHLARRYGPRDQVSNSWDSKPSWVTFSLTIRSVRVSKPSEVALISSVRVNFSPAALRCLVTSSITTPRSRIARTGSNSTIP